MIKYLLCFILFLNVGVINAQSVHMVDPLDNMRILKPDIVGFAGSEPIDQRGVEFAKYLSASVKIDVSAGSGSGTIVYYDPQKNLAYVASCGHLWNHGVFTQEQAEKNPLYCKVTMWWQNGKKLPTPKSYNARVQFYSYLPGQDTSLLTFTPDFTPTYFPIAPANYQYKPGKHAHSLGCDGGREVAHYDIRIVGLSGTPPLEGWTYDPTKDGIDLVTEENSPRPGRSGGGLMDDSGYYIATCVATEYRNGTGRGYFTCLQTIHNFWKQQKNFSFLLDIHLGVAKDIPIKNRKGSKDIVDSSYILLPEG